MRRKRRRKKGGGGGEGGRGERRSRRGPSVPYGGGEGSRRRRRRSINVNVCQAASGVVVDVVLVPAGLPGVPQGAPKHCHHKHLRLRLAAEVDAQPSTPAAPLDRLLLLHLALFLVGASSPACA